MQPMKPSSQLPARMADIAEGESYLLEQTAETVTVARRMSASAVEMVVITRHTGDCVLRLRIDPVTHLYKPLSVDPYFWTFDIDGRVATSQDLDDSNLSGYRRVVINASQRRLGLQR